MATDSWPHSCVHDKTQRQCKQLVDCYLPSWPMLVGIKPLHYPVQALVP